MTAKTAGHGQTRIRPLTRHLAARCFACKAVQNGQVVRRKLRDIERYAGMEAFLAEVRDRGFQAVQNREQVIIFCNNAPVRKLV